MASITVDAAIKQTLVQFIVNLKYVFNEAQSHVEIEIVTKFFSAMPEHKVVDHCMERFFPHIKMIREKDEIFFDKNKDAIFKGLPQKRIDHYASYWKDNKISSDHKEKIWQYLTTLSLLLEKKKKGK